MSKIKYLPKDTFELIENPDELDNFALKLNKFPIYEKDKFYFFKSDKGNTEYKINFKLSDKTILTLNKKIVANLFDSKEKYNLISLKQDWNMAIGLGSESVYDTSMTLHHIYGIPYIPGQAVKGMVRNYIISEIFENNEENAMKNQEFYKIFGNRERAGEVIFFDSYSENEPKIDVDIMNPHYGEYYGAKGKEKPPGDYYNPVPIPFLIVKDSTFNFYIGSKKQDINNYKINYKTISEWLEEALINHGIGAKTAVGYGYFNGLSQKEKEQIKLKEKMEAERLQKEEEDKKKQELLNKLTGLDKELKEIEMLPDNLKEIKLTELVKNLDNKNEEDKIKTANFLKNEYIKMDKWKNPSKKQKEKIDKIKKILGE